MGKQDWSSFYLKMKDLPWWRTSRLQTLTEARLGVGAGIVRGPARQLRQRTRLGLTLFR
jgi:hypothetical protein